MANQRELILMHMEKYGSITHRKQKPSMGVRVWLPESMNYAAREWLSRLKW